MDKVIGIIMSILLSVSMAACGADNTSESAISKENQTENFSVQNENNALKAEKESVSEGPAENNKMEENIMYIKVGDAVLTAELADNSSAEALKEMLSEGDVTIDMHDYGNFEKVGELGRTLPVNDEQITTQAGDIILYQGNNITIYYDKNSWNFTRLGKIKDVSQKEIKKILGNGNVTVTLSLEK